MTSYWEALRRSLIDRADALGKYMGDLRAAHARDDDGFSLALEVCRQYAEALKAQVDSDWGYARDDPARQRAELSAHLRRFLQRERWIDQASPGVLRRMYPAH